MQSYQHKITDQLNLTRSAYSDSVSPCQIDFVNAIHTSNITIGIGEENKGKTKSAIFSALNRLATNETSTIYLTCSDINTINADAIVTLYLNDLLYFLNMPLLNELLKNGAIKALPLTELRDTDFSNSIVLVEDSEFCTSNEISSLIKNTRYNSRLVLMGNLCNSFLKNNGLKNLIHNLHTKDLNFSNTDLQLILFKN